VAFLHFQEGRAGLFADLKVERSWSRMAVNSSEERLRLLAKVKACLAGR